MKNTLIIAVAVGLALQGTSLVAQDHSKMPGMDKQKHREMMPMHHKMMEEQKAQDTEIDKLAATMNSASGEQRIAAIIAVLNKLIEQRKVMHAEMASHLDK